MHSEIVRFLDEREAEMLQLLRDLALVQSGSYNKRGVDRVLNLVLGSLADGDVRATVVRQQTYGNHLILSSAATHGDVPQVLICGHMDTVFPQGTDFRWFREHDDRVNGPGVIDMKGGLVIIIYALKALESAGLLDSIPVQVIMNSDEEVGSPSSSVLIEQEARKSAFAFVLECGGMNGGVVTGRKGKLGLRLKVSGRAGHAAAAVQDKASAVLELAHKIVAIEALNDPQRGISVNVGQVSGGIGPNTVPERAEASVDVRYITRDDRDELEGRIAAIVRRVVAPGTTAEIAPVSERPPMEQTGQNRRLFQIVQSQAQELGQTVHEEFRNGVSDANLIAGQNVPVVDGLGPIGDRDHSSDEFMVKESLLVRARLFTLTLVRAWDLHERGGLF